MGLKERGVAWDGLMIGVVFYVVHLQVEDYTRRLRTDDLGIPANPADR